MLYEVFLNCDTLLDYALKKCLNSYILEIFSYCDMASETSENAQTTQKKPQQQPTKAKQLNKERV